MKFINGMVITKYIRVLFFYLIIVSCGSDIKYENKRNDFVIRGCNTRLETLLGNVHIENNRIYSLEKESVLVENLISKKFNSFRNNNLKDNYVQYRYTVFGDQFFLLNILTGDFDLQKLNSRDQSISLELDSTFFKDFGYTAVSSFDSVIALYGSVYGLKLLNPYTKEKIVLNSKSTNDYRFATVRNLNNEILCFHVNDENQLLMKKYSADISKEIWDIKLVDVETRNSVGDQIVSIQESNEKYFIAINDELFVVNVSDGKLLFRKKFHNCYKLNVGKFKNEIVLIEQKKNFVTNVFNISSLDYSLIPKMKIDPIDKEVCAVHFLKDKICLVSSGKVLEISDFNKSSLYLKNDIDYESKNRIFYDIVLNSSKWVSII